MHQETLTIKVSYVQTQKCVSYNGLLVSIFIKIKYTLKYRVMH